MNHPPEIKWKVQLLNAQLKHCKAWFGMMGSEQLAEHTATAQQFQQLADMSEVAETALTAQRDMVNQVIAEIPNREELKQQLSRILEECERRHVAAVRNMRDQNIQ